MISKSYVINRHSLMLFSVRKNNNNTTTNQTKQTNPPENSNSRKGLGLPFLVVLDEQIRLVRLDQPHISPHLTPRIPEYPYGGEEFLMSADVR